MFKDRLKELRKQRKLTQIEFAKAFNVSNGAVGNWESGTRAPDSDTLGKIADFFDVSVDYLLGREASFPSPEITEDYTTFPVLGEVAAGYDHIAVETWDGDKIDIPNSYLKGRSKEEFFVLKVTGDSMYPMYQEGDKVLILKCNALSRSGEIAVVLYDDEKTTLKKVEFVDGEDWLNLVPINPNVPPTEITGERLEHCRIIGIPKLLIREI